MKYRAQVNIYMIASIHFAFVLVQSALACNGKYTAIVRSRVTATNIQTEILLKLFAMKKKDLQIHGCKDVMSNPVKFLGKLRHIRHIIQNIKSVVAKLIRYKFVEPECDIFTRATIHIKLPIIPIVAMTTPG